MFERYTEPARRTIFYARYEASTLGSEYIQTEHLLLGLLREDQALKEKMRASRSANRLNSAPRLVNHRFAVEKAANVRKSVYIRKAYGPQKRLAAARRRSCARGLSNGDA